MGSQGNGCRHRHINAVSTSSTPGWSGKGYINILTLAFALPCMLKWNLYRSLSENQQAKSQWSRPYIHER